MSIEQLSTFLKNRVADLNESIETALEGLGDGHTCNLAKTQSALNALAYTTKAIEDICPLLEAEKESRPDPRILMSMLGFNFPLSDDDESDEEPAVPKDPIPNDPRPDRDTSTSGKSSAPVDPATYITQ